MRLILVLVKCVSIIVKTKFINFDNMNDIYNKLNFITNYTKHTTTDTLFIKKKKKKTH